MALPRASTAATKSKKVQRSNTKASGSGVARKPAARKAVGRTAGIVEETVEINRAPVLTLWMTICLQRLGWTEDTALSVAQVVTGRCANAKGKALGIIKSSKAEGAASSKKKKEAAPAAKKPQEEAEISGHKVALRKASDGVLKAVEKSGAPVEPSQVQAYLLRCYRGQEALDGVASVMREAARTHSKAALKSNAFSMYERFRPAWRGWGQRSSLHMQDIRAVGA
mmetsp:Transcript_71318/g.133400  ORF Transcript_71318/g.133400 Transcript_71318/m.133400 type:complete len:225 (-) Transcript_71318:129-803(-)